MERLCPLADTPVWVLTIEQVDLLKSTTICLDTIPTAHTDNGWSNLNQLVYAWLILTSTLPHVAKDQ